MAILFVIGSKSGQKRSKKKKVKKEHFWPFLEFLISWLVLKSYSKILKPSVTWPDVSSFSVQNLMAIQFNASRAGQTMDLGDLLVQKKLFDSINWYHIFCTFHWQESFLFCSGTTVGQQRVSDFQKIIHWQLLKNVFLANCFLF